MFQHVIMTSLLRKQVISLVAKLKISDCNRCSKADIDVLFGDRLSLKQYENHTYHRAHIHAEFLWGL